MSEPAGRLVTAESDPPAEPSADRTPGWREVLLLAGAVVGIVLGLAVITSLLPVWFQDVVFRTPLAIAILVVGTVGLLSRLAQHGRDR